MTSSTEMTAAHDEFEARLSEYLDGSLGADEARAVEQHLDSCDHCRAALKELRETMSALSGLHKVSAPADFDRDVRETIRRRSGGRFFGRRAFGDRVPLELLALVALGLGLALYFFLRGSDTGSLRPFEQEAKQPAIHEDAPSVVPRP